MNPIGQDIEERGQHLRRLSRDIGGRICTEISRSLWGAAKNVKSIPVFDIGMNYIRHFHLQSTSSGWSIL
jgi:hypothetical protein